MKRNIDFRRLAYSPGAGIFWGIVSAVSFGSSPFFAKNLYNIGFDVDNVLFWRFCPVVLILAISVLGKRRKLCSWKEFGSSFVAGILFFLTSLALFHCYQSMDVGVAAAIFFSYPVIVLLLSRIFLKKKLSRRALTAIGLAVTGVTLLSMNGTVSHISVRGIAVALTAAFCYAGYNLWTAHSAAKKLPSDFLALLIMGCCLIAYFYRLDFGRALHLDLSFAAVSYIAGLSLVAALLAIFSAVLALKICGATTTAVLGALEPLSAVLIGILCFGEALSWLKCLGVAFVIISVLLIAFSRHHKI